MWWWWWVVVDQAITNPISGPSLSFVFCLLALSLTIIQLRLQASDLIKEDWGYFGSYP